MKTKELSVQFKNPKWEQQKQKQKNMEGEGEEKRGGCRGGESRGKGKRKKDMATPGEINIEL